MAERTTPSSGANEGGLVVKPCETWTANRARRGRLKARAGQALETNQKAKSEALASRRVVLETAVRRVEERQFCPCWSLDQRP